LPSILLARASSASRAATTMTAIAHPGKPPLPLWLLPLPLSVEAPAAVAGSVVATGVAAGEATTVGLAVGLACTVGTGVEVGVMTRGTGIEGEGGGGKGYSWDWAGALGVVVAREVESGVTFDVKVMTGAN